MLEFYILHGVFKFVVIILKLGFFIFWLLFFTVSFFVFLRCAEFLLSFLTQIT